MELHVLDTKSDFLIPISLQTLFKDKKCPPSDYKGIRIRIFVARNKSFRFWRCILEQPRDDNPEPRTVSWSRGYPGSVLYST